MGALGRENASGDNWSSGSSGSSDSSMCSAFLDQYTDPCCYKHYKHEQYNARIWLTNLSITGNAKDTAEVDVSSFHSLHEELERLEPHADGRGDFARARTFDGTIGCSIVW